MGEGRGEGISSTFTLTLTLSLKGEGTDRAQILRDIFFCLVTEEQKNRAFAPEYCGEKACTGNDREPIGRKGKPTRPVKQKVSRRRYEDDDDYDDYDDYEDEEPMPRKGKGKGKGRKPSWQTRLAMATAKTGYRFCRADRHLRRLSRSKKFVAVLMARSGNCLRQFMAEWSILSQT